MHWKFMLPIILTMVLMSACTGLGLPLDAQRATGTPIHLNAGGDPERGREAILRYGCQTCHSIPGIATANSFVGPPLDRWAERHYISGRFPNQPTHLIQFIRFPQAFKPGSAMPNLGVTDQDARDISAYLYTLQENRAWFGRN
jgi:cytochrome c